MFAIAIAFAFLVWQLAGRSSAQIPDSIYLGRAAASCRGAAGVVTYVTIAVVAFCSRQRARPERLPVVAPSLALNQPY